MNDPANQHVVPALILRRFTDSSGYLNVFEKCKAKHGIKKQKPENTFRKRNLYTSQEWETKRKKFDTEFMFSALEDKVAPILEKIHSSIASRKSPNLSHKEKEIIDELICAQLKRTPESLAQLDPQKAIEDQIQKVADDDGIAVSELKLRIPTGAVEHGIKILIPEMLRLPSLKLMELLSSMGLVIGKIENQKRNFIISSKPIAGSSKNYQSPQRHQASYMWFPIAKNLALCPGGKPNEEQIIELSDSVVRAINEQLFRQSNAIAGPSREQIVSLIRPWHKARGLKVKLA